MADPSRSNDGLRALLRACLLAWPRDERESVGRELVEAALESVTNADRGGWRNGLGEAGAILVGGLRRRRERLTRVIAEAASGWTTDLRIGLRSLRRSPGLLAAVTGTLAIAIAANTVVFALVDAVLLRTPPFSRPQELVSVWSSLPGSDRRIAVAGPDAAVLEERSRRLDRIAFTIRGVDGALARGAGAQARHVGIASVTEDFFEVLGIEAALGRTFQEGDAASGDPEAGPTFPVVVADGLWRTTLGADPGIVGSRLRLNGFPVTVIGVMPPDFDLPLPPEAGIMTDVDVWSPLTVPLADFHREEDRLLDRDSDNTGVVVGRLASGATLQQARDELDRIGADLRRRVPAYAAAGVGFDVRPLLRDATAHVRPWLLALLGASSALLLVGVLNVAALLVARGIERAPELAVRQALGGSRTRIVRQILVENGVLVLGGLAGAVVLAAAATPVVAGVVPRSFGPARDVTLDPRATGFAVATAGLALLALGLAPAAKAVAREARGVLGVASGRTAPGGSKARERLVAAQVALTVVLVLGAGFVLRSVDQLSQIHPGFQAEGALTFQVSLRMPDRYRGPAERAEIMKEIETGVRDLPGVHAVGLVGVLPLGGDRWTQPYGLPGQPRSDWDESRADFQMISSGYFDAIGARLVEGRTFTAHEDLVEDERVVVVDEKLASRVAPRGSALDAVIGVPLDGSAVQARIVGVVEHIRHERLDIDGREAVYVPYRQEASRDVAFVVRTSGAPGLLAPAMRRTVQDVDPAIPVYDVVPLAEYIRDATAPSRFALTLLTSFALLTLACAAVGVFGVVAYDVARRTRDIGLRVAVGASRAEVARGVVKGGLRIAAPGVGIGVVLGIAAADALNGLLTGVGVTDPWVWGAVLALVGLIVVAASWIPARRASRLSPVVALRPD